MEQKFKIGQIVWAGTFGHDKHGEPFARIRRRRLIDICSLTGRYSLLKVGFKKPIYERHKPLSYFAGTHNPENVFASKAEAISHVLKLRDDAVAKLATVVIEER